MKKETKAVTKADLKLLVEEVLLLDKYKRLLWNFNTENIFNKYESILFDNYTLFVKDLDILL